VNVQKVQMAGPSSSTGAAASPLQGFQTLVSNLHSDVTLDDVMVSRIAFYVVEFRWDLIIWRSVTQSKTIVTSIERSRCLACDGPCCLSIVQYCPVPFEMQ